MDFMGDVITFITTKDTVEGSTIYYRKSTNVWVDLYLYSLQQSSAFLFLG